MSEMVERLAWALCALEHRDPGATYEMTIYTVVGSREGTTPATAARTITRIRWNDYEAAARTALAAMHEPTQAMCAPADEYGSTPNVWCIAWQVMIVAALKP